VYNWFVLCGRRFIPPHTPYSAPSIKGIVYMFKVFVDEVTYE
jgi:hypothetical protein